jgi:prophage regulatory protein
MTHFILRLPEVKTRTGLSRSTIYLRMANGDFPRAVSLGGRAVGWLESDINQWLSDKIESSRNDQSCQRV